VSIAPETIAANMEAYAETIKNSEIAIYPKYTYIKSKLTLQEA